MSRNIKQDESFDDYMIACVQWFEHAARDQYKMNCPGTKLFMEFVA